MWTNDWPHGLLDAAMQQESPMKRFLLSAVALVAGLLGATSTEALAGHDGHSGSGKGGHGSMQSSHEGHGRQSRNSYYKKHGTKFSHGYFYHGRNHRHWDYRCWSKRYGCNCYWDSGCRSWYYWSEPKCCYYPICYATVCTPTVVTTTTTTTTTATELNKIPVAPAGVSGPDE
jgi:hypothetical protein